MAYRIEGKDIVISGFEGGIAPSPYQGIADMRNIDIISYPGEASVNFGQVSVSTPPVWTAKAYTAQDSGDTITVDSTTGLYNGCAIRLNTFSGSGPSTNVVYYVGNITATTFQLYLMPAVTGTPVAITADGSGTLTTYQYGNQRGIGDISPVARVDNLSNRFQNGPNGIYLTDASNYAWYIAPSTPSAYPNIPPNSLIFLGNIGGIGAGTGSTSGIAIFNGYLVLLGPIASTNTAIASDAADVSDLFSAGPAAEWSYQWTLGVGSLGGINRRIDTLVSQEDGNLYFTNTNGLGAITQIPGQSFDPSDGNTYTVSDSALLIPTVDQSTCIAELGSNLLIGGRGKFVYVWNKIDPGFTSLLNIPDEFISRIVATNQNAYVFAGVRGRIFITNGSGIDLFKKIPDYLTGIVSPYVTWWDASFSRNQLYFTMVATTNANAANSTVAGVWAIDLETEALRLMNKTVNTGYGATTTMVIPMPRISSGGASNSPTFPNNIEGTGVVVGWYTGSTYGIDVGQDEPYDDYESYIDTDMIPVGTFLDPFTPSQIEWKTSRPIVSGEGVAIFYRTNINDAFVAIGESTTAGALSDLYKTNFQKAQWVQFRIYIKSTDTDPSFVRLTEIRIRDWPSGKNMQ